MQALCVLMLLQELPLQTAQLCCRGGSASSCFWFLIIQLSTDLCSEPDAY